MQHFYILWPLLSMTRIDELLTRDSNKTDRVVFATGGGHLRTSFVRRDVRFLDDILNSPALKHG